MIGGGGGGYGPAALCCRLVLRLGTVHLSWRSVKSLRRQKVDYEILQLWCLLAFHNLFTTMGVETVLSTILPFYNYFQFLLFVITFLPGTKMPNFLFEVFLVPGVERVHSSIREVDWTSVKWRLHGEIKLLPLRLLDWLILPGIIISIEKDDDYVDDETGRGREDCRRGRVVHDDDTDGDEDENDDGVEYAEEEDPIVIDDDDGGNAVVDDDDDSPPVVPPLDDSSSVIEEDRLDIPLTTVGEDRTRDRDGADAAVETAALPPFMGEGKENDMPPHPPPPSDCDVLAVKRGCYEDGDGDGGGGTSSAATPSHGRPIGRGSRATQPPGYFPATNPSPTKSRGIRPRRLVAGASPTFAAAKRHSPSSSLSSESDQRTKRQSPSSSLSSNSPTSPSSPGMGTGGQGRLDGAIDAATASDVRRMRSRTGGGGGGGGGRNDGGASPRRTHGGLVSESTKSPSSSRNTRKRRPPSSSPSTASSSSSPASSSSNDSTTSSTPGGRKNEPPSSTATKLMTSSSSRRRRLEEYIQAKRERDEFHKENRQQGNKRRHPKSPPARSDSSVASPVARSRLTASSLRLRRFSREHDRLPPPAASPPIVGGRTAERKEATTPGAATPPSPTNAVVASPGSSTVGAFRGRCERERMGASGGGDDGEENVDGSTSLATARSSQQSPPSPARRGNEVFGHPDGSSVEVVSPNSHRDPGDGRRRDGNDRRRRSSLLLPLRRAVTGDSRIRLRDHLFDLDLPPTGGGGAANATATPTPSPHVVGEKISPRRNGNRRRDESSGAAATDRHRREAERRQRRQRGTVAPERTARHGRRRLGGEFSYEEEGEDGRRGGQRRCRRAGCRTVGTDAKEETPSFPSRRKRRDDPECPPPLSSSVCETGVSFGTAAAGSTGVSGAVGAKRVANASNDIRDVAGGPVKDTSRITAGGPSEEASGVTLRRSKRIRGRRGEGLPN